MKTKRGQVCRATRRASAISLLGAFVALGPSFAHAAPPDATGCFPPVVGIPWDSGAPTINSLNDLRWNGSFAYQWSNGTLQDGAFNTLLGTDASGNKTLYVYYKNLVHRSQINYGDGVQFGISYDDTTPAGVKETVGQIVVLQFGQDSFSGPNGDGTWRAATVDGSGNPIPADPSTTGVAQYLQQVTTYDSAGTPTLHTTTTPAGTDASWIKSNSYLWVLADPSDATKLYYVAQIALPIKTVSTWTTPGLFIDATQLATPALGVPFWGDELSFEISTTAVVPRPWPNKDYTAQGRVNADPSQPPSPDHWGRLQPVGYPTCTGGGLAFGPSDILDNSGYLISLYNADSSPLGFSPGKNNLSVNVTNRGPTVTPSDIHATFNIAPFGSQTAHSVSWQPLNVANNAIACKTGKKGDFATCSPAAVTAAPIESAATGGSSAFTLSTVTPWQPSWSYTCAVKGDDGVLYSNRADIGTDCTTGGLGTWLPSASDAAAPNYNAIFEHECMLVQLNTTKSDVQFDTQSQFMNMHVAAHASNFSQTARIDSSGIPPIKGSTGHYLYFVVDTRNMPTSIPKGIDSPYTNDYLQNLLYGGNCDGDVCEYSRRGNTPTFDYVSQTFPTTIVHVYHDTGMYRTVRKKKIEVYEPQSSYGYFVSHEGKLYGWNVGLSGGGVKKMSDNVYRVFIPNDKAVEVTTNITAIDQPPSSCGH